MTKNEFITKYGNVKVKFSGYHKYVFTFMAILPDGKILTCGCGGNSDDIYKMEVVPDFEETVESLDPQEGALLEKGKEIESFYDY